MEGAAGRPSPACGETQPGQTWIPGRNGGDPIAICGQGLAGTLLAWHLSRLGKKVLVYDASEAMTSSRVAAGIVTPVTGQRLTLARDFEGFRQEASACYDAMAAELGARYFHTVPQIRLWRGREEEARFQQRRADPEFAAQTVPAGQAGQPPVDPALFHGVGRGFEMPRSGWLDTRGWLAAAARWLEQEGALRKGVRLNPADVKPLTACSHAGGDPPRKILRQSGVLLPDGTRAEAVVFCEGIQARHNPWFSWLRWKPAKGDILTVRIPALAGEPRIISRKGWLLPVTASGSGSGGGPLWRTGSTYDWTDTGPDAGPLPAGRKILEEQLSHLLRVPWETLCHEAAVRPIIHESLVRMGRHPVHPSLVFFNGLGSKGVLHGPRYAALLAAHLAHGTPLPHETDVAGN